MLPIKYINFAAIVIFVIIADQITKWAISSSIALYTSITVIPGFLNLIHIQNPGTAFGMFAESSGLLRNVLLLAASLIAMTVVIYLCIKTPKEYPILIISFALILGGAIGNILDRLRLGSVIDFIDLYIGNFHWPAFNVADSAISIGMLIFAFYVVFRKMPV